MHWCQKFNLHFMQVWKLCRVFDCMEGCASLMLWILSSTHSNEWQGPAVWQLMITLCIEVPWRAIIEWALSPMTAFAIWPSSTPMYVMHTLRQVHVLWVHFRPYSMCIRMCTTVCVFHVLFDLLSWVYCVCFKVCSGTVAYRMIF